MRDNAHGESVILSEYIEAHDANDFSPTVVLQSSLESRVTLVYDGRIKRELKILSAELLKDGR